MKETRGVEILSDRQVARDALTRNVSMLANIIDDLNQEEEGNSEEMSNSWERKLCGKCDGHGKVDGEPCPRCGGTGLAEITDERIYPNREDKGQ